MRMRSGSVPSLPFLILAALAAASTAAATPSPRESFFKHHLWMPGLPASLPELRARLEALRDSAPGLDGPRRPDLVYAMVPEGRSLQAALTDYAHPRVLFGFVPSMYGDGRRRFYGDLVDRLFVAFSERQNTLEVISWNPHEGRFSFESVLNFMPSPGKERVLLEDGHVISKGFTQRELCMTCHQSGGPLYANKPWSESSSGLGPDPLGKSLVSRLIEKALGATEYLGLVIDPVDEHGGRRAAAGEIHVVVKDAHSSLLNARRMARQGCGDDLDCRVELLGAVVRLARAGYYSSPASLFAVALPFREAIKHRIAPRWPAHGFAYPDPTIVDRDPVRAPSLPVPVEANPALRRRLVNEVPVGGREGALEEAASQLLLRAFEGMGFGYGDLPAIVACPQRAVDAALSSERLRGIARDWNLNDADSDPRDFAEALHEQVLDLLARECGRGAGG